MKRYMIAVVLGTLLAGTVAAAQDSPPRDQRWLQQLVGEWKSEAKLVFAPGQPPVECKGTESVRSIGGHWIVSEITTATPQGPMTGIMTVGYNAEKKQFVGTWIDSVMPHLWTYTGTLDAAGKVLTLEAEGPSMTAPGKTAKYRDVTEWKSREHKVMTSSVQGEDGKWTTFMTVEYRRVR